MVELDLFHAKEPFSIIIGFCIASTVNTRIIKKFKLGNKKMAQNSKYLNLFKLYHYVLNGTRC